MILKKMVIKYNTYNNHRKRCLLLVRKKLKTKITRSHFINIKIAKFKNTNFTQCW